MLGETILRGKILCTELNEHLNEKCPIVTCKINSEIMFCMTAIRRAIIIDSLLCYRCASHVGPSTTH
jgi:hypothetical protein